MARRRSGSSRRRMPMVYRPMTHSSGLGAITDSPYFIPGLIGVGALAFLLLRKKKPTEAEVQKIVGAAQAATKAAAAESVAAAEAAATPAVQQKDQMVSMGSEKPKTVTELVAQVRGSEIASGPAGTEMQGGGSVSADPREQLKLMSTVDFIEEVAKSSPAFKAAVMAGVPVGGDLGAEMERRFGADGRALFARKVDSSANLRRALAEIQRIYAAGLEMELLRDAKIWLSEKRGDDDSFYLLAYYNVLTQELADRASGKKPEPVTSEPQPAVAAQPGKVFDKSSGMMVDVKPTKIVKIGEISVKFRYPVQIVDDVVRVLAPQVASAGLTLEYKQSTSEYWHSVKVFGPEGVSLDTAIVQLRVSPDLAAVEAIGMATGGPATPPSGRLPASTSGTYMRKDGVLMCRGVGRQPDRPCPTQPLGPGVSQPPPGSKPPSALFPTVGISQTKPVGPMQPAVMQSSLPKVTSGGGGFVASGGFSVKPFGR